MARQKNPWARQSPKLVGVLGGLCLLGLGPAGVCQAAPEMENPRALPLPPAPSFTAAQDTPLPPAPSFTAAQDTPLPPAPSFARVAGPREPQLSAGVFAGVCALSGKSFWGATDFCAGGVADLLWFRHRDLEPGAGLGVTVSTSGFQETRLSLGPVLSLAAGGLVRVDGSAGPLLAINGQGAGAGFFGQLGFGLRGFDPGSSYASSHQLFIRYEQLVEPGPLRPEALRVLLLALRIDAHWLLTPLHL